ncbi:hypothetical protein [Delftia lacustris]|uniref:hypothetical protein n=1 Tax=Delftia lacustris TaxID=558537 RepID=UPI0035A6E954
MDQTNLPYRARQALGMSTTEAGQLVHVTRRTWEMWESGKVTMPRAKQELFISKLEGVREEHSELIVVIASDGSTPIDVVSRDGFCSLVQQTDDTYIIRSLAVNRQTGQPYVHATAVHPAYNKHVIEKAATWTSVIDR